MSDEHNPEVPAVEQPKAEPKQVSAPQTTSEERFDKTKLAGTARWLADHEGSFEFLQDQYYDHKGIEKPVSRAEYNEVLKIVKDSRLETARSKAILKYGLSEDDADLLTSDDPEGIAKQAKKLSERFKSIKPSESKPEPKIYEPKIYEPEPPKTKLEAAIRTLRDAEFPLE